MEKLKIYGKKPGFEGFIATISVKDGKLEVESEEPKVKKDLKKALKEGTLDEDFTIGARRRMEEKNKEGQVTAYLQVLVRIKPGDKGYLLDLSSKPVFCSGSLEDWEAGKGRKIGDYEMDCGLSRMVEEDITDEELKVLEEKVRHISRSIEEEEKEEERRKKEEKEK